MLPTLNRTHAPNKTYPARILQFGEGNFLRAFVDWMVQRMNEKVDFNTGVTIIQPLGMGQAGMLNHQDGLYHVILKGIDNGKYTEETTLIDSVTEAISPTVSFDRFLETADNPSYRFVISNTTEAGIVYNNHDKAEDEPQESYPGKLTKWLFERYLNFEGDYSKGVIVMPVELIENNGTRLKEIILMHAEHWALDDGFIDWLHEGCTFCNTLVDRIVPGFPEGRLAEIQQKLGYDDQLVTEGEFYHLWVIEGPAWLEDEWPAAKAGLNVIFTHDLTPYRKRKVRVLNGSHTAMVPMGLLAGIETVREAMEHKELGLFIRQMVKEEIVPAAGMDEDELQAYAETIFERFLNPAIHHALATIALNSLSKFNTRLLPSILDFYQKYDRWPDRLTAAWAALIRMYSGDFQGREMPVNDDAGLVKRLRNYAVTSAQKGASMKERVQQMLNDDKLWPNLAGDLDTLADKIAQYLENMERDPLYFRRLN